jgi:hypothetical protein
VIGRAWLHDRGNAQVSLECSDHPHDLRFLDRRGGIDRDPASGQVLATLPAAGFALDDRLTAFVPVDPGKAARAFDRGGPAKVAAVFDLIGPAKMAAVFDLIGPAAVLDPEPEVEGNRFVPATTLDPADPTVALVVPAMVFDQVVPAIVGLTSPTGR